MLFNIKSGSFILYRVISTHISLVSFNTIFFSIMTKESFILNDACCSRIQTVKLFRFILVTNALSLRLYFSYEGTIPFWRINKCKKSGNYFILDIYVYKCVCICFFFLCMPITVIEHNLRGTKEYY
jgi:hypothetical protein